MILKPGALGFHSVPLVLQVGQSFLDKVHLFRTELLPEIHQMNCTSWVEQLRVERAGLTVE
jgi:hypothetical protein